MKWRVLWIDAAGEGRFTTIEAASSEQAAWTVSQMTESREAAYEGIERIDPPKTSRSRA